eukprot:5714585-Pleurochrysis_carterae.AAC.1
MMQSDVKKSGRASCCMPTHTRSADFAAACCQAVNGRGGMFHKQQAHARPCNSRVRAQRA